MDDDLSGESKNARTAYRWNCRVPGGEDVLKDVLPRNPVVLAIVEQLLGPGRVADPSSARRGTRGVYCTLPMGDRLARGGEVIFTEPCTFSIVIH